MVEFSYLNIEQKLVWLLIYTLLSWVRCKKETIKEVGHLDAEHIVINYLIIFYYTESLSCSEICMPNVTTAMRKVPNCH